MDLIVVRHVGQCAAGDNPDHVAFGIKLEAHDDIGRQAILHVDVPHTLFIDDVDSTAVASEQDLTVKALADSEALDVLDAVRNAVASGDRIAFDDVHAAGDSHQYGSVRPFPYCA